MKKCIIFLLLLCFLLPGCGKKEKKSNLFDTMLDLQDGLFAADGLELFETTESVLAKLGVSAEDLDDGGGRRDPELLTDYVEYPEFSVLIRTKYIFTHDLFYGPTWQITDNGLGKDAFIEQVYQHALAFFPESYDLTPLEKGKECRLEDAEGNKVSIFFHEDVDGNMHAVIDLRKDRATLAEKLGIDA